MNKKSWCFVVALMVTPAASVAQDFGGYTLQQWRLLAEQGDELARSVLGFMYFHGDGVAQDYAEAMRWYRLSAEQGEAGAQAVLGYMYFQGQGVPQDYVTAHMWYNLGASTGLGNAVYGRDWLESLMTPADISEAQRRARVCFNSNYRDCD